MYHGRKRVMRAVTCLIWTGSYSRCPDWPFKWCKCWPAASVTSVWHYSHKASYWPNKQQAGFTLLFPHQLNVWDALPVPPCSTRMTQFFHNPWLKLISAAPLCVSSQLSLCNLVRARTKQSKTLSTHWGSEWSIHSAGSPHSVSNGPVLMRWLCLISAANS